MTHVVSKGRGVSPRNAPRPAVSFGALALAALLAGCTSYAEAQAERGALNCELLDACGQLEPLGYDSVEACKETAADQKFSEDDCPEYDAGQMSECLDATRAAVEAADCGADLSPICAVCG